MIPERIRPYKTLIDAVHGHTVGIAIEEADFERMDRLRLISGMGGCGAIIDYRPTTKVQNLVPTVQMVVKKPEQVALYKNIRNFLKSHGLVDTGSVKI